MPDNNKTITITKEQLAVAITETMNNKRLTELISSQPLFAVVFAVFGAELANHLFDEKKKEDEGEEENE